MTELSCQQCREHAAEIALGVFCGRERAGALAHLNSCTACQDMVSELTVTVDRLVSLLPGAEPPAGFEQRVITAVAPPPPHTRRWWMPAAAAVLAVAFAAGGWVAGRAHNDAQSPPAMDLHAGVRTVMFTPLTAGDRQLGQAYIYPGHPSWMYLSLDPDSDATSGTVHCELVHRDGSTVPLGTFSVTKGYGAWGAPAPIDPKTLATIRLTDSDGRPLATARFTATASALDGHIPPTQTALPQPPRRGGPARPSPTGTGLTHQQHQQRQGRGIGDHRSPVPTGDMNAVRDH